MACWERDTVPPRWVFGEEVCGGCLKRKENTSEKCFGAILFEWLLKPVQGFPRH